MCFPTTALNHAGYESNVLVRQLLETAGNGRVLVVDGGASLRCAVLCAVCCVLFVLPRL